MDLQKSKNHTGPRQQIMELHSNNRCNRGFLSAMLPMIDSDFNKSDGLAKTLKPWRARTIKQ